MLLDGKTITKNKNKSLRTVYEKKNEENKIKFEYCRQVINLRKQTKFFKQIYK
jgi:hypothetical protein